MGFDDRAVGVTEREFLAELSLVWPEQFAAVGVVGAFEDSPDAIFLSCAFINQSLASPDEIPQGADLVRWDIALGEHARMEHVRDPFCVKTISFDRCFSDQAVL